MTKLFDAVLRAGKHKPGYDEMLPRLLAAKLFQLEASGINEVVQLGKRHWREWAPLVLPPFPSFWIEWRPGELLSHPDINVIGGEKPGMGDMVDALAAFVEDGLVAIIVGDLRQPALFTLPISLSLRRLGDAESFDPERTADGGIEVLSRERVLEAAWGHGYKRVFGSYPPFIVAGPNASDPRYGVDKLDARGLSEFTGCFRVLCCALALINTPRAVDLVDQAGKTSTFVGGKVRPYPKRQLIVIRPDAVRRVCRAARLSNEPPTPKREHDVRSHFRHYRSGKVAVVRAHKRGDAALGTVQSEYLVEREPKISDFVPNEELPSKS